MLIAAAMSAPDVLPSVTVWVIVPTGVSMVTTAPTAMSGTEMVYLAAFLILALRGEASHCRLLTHPVDERTKGLTDESH